MTRLFAAVLCLGWAGLEAQSLDRLDLHDVQAEAKLYRGKHAIHLTENGKAQGETFAMVRGTEILDGTIDVDVSGAPGKNADATARGFIGIAFRIQPDGQKFELVYLRPSNGRAEDQLQRNHSTQYVSAPEWTWQRTRKETPGLYESYVDLEPGAWTHVKIAVARGKARLYVNGAEQPCLVVNDLKLGPQKGGIALWIGPGTDGYFANLNVH